jgi:hypothetical protein
VTENPAAQMDERGPYFDETPDALTIMHWFLDKGLAGEWVGSGGDADYILSEGCWLDLLAHVDHDDQWFWLLSIGTSLDGGPSTYDLLFVAANLDGRRTCEWRNEPAPTQPWHYEGLVWFAGQIEEWERTYSGAAQ